jgi:hypothetical protein
LQSGRDAHYPKNIRRLQKFQELLNPGGDDTLLDIGGYPGDWTAYPPMVGRIDILNLQPVRFDQGSFPDHNIQTLIGDGRNLEAADSSYDIVFSNSVIEHLGNLKDQQRFANEVRRVGKALWIQTPAKEFFFEPHYLAPFLHWLPRSAQSQLARNFTLWGWMQRPTRLEVHGRLHSPADSWRDATAVSRLQYLLREAFRRPSQKLRGLETF